MRRTLRPPWRNGRATGNWARVGWYAGTAKVCKGLQSFRGGSSKLPFRAHLAECPALNRRDKFPLYELRTALEALRPVTP